MLPKLVHRSVASKTRNLRVWTERWGITQHRTTPIVLKHQLSEGRSLSRLFRLQQNVLTWKRSVTHYTARLGLIMADVLPNQGLFAFGHYRAIDQEAVLSSCVGTIHRGYGSGGRAEEAK